MGWKATKGATSYHITYTSDNGASWSLGAYGHTSVRINIGGVDNSKTYIVGVRALNEHGGSGWRNSAPAGPFTPPATPPPPATPSWVNVARADGTLRVTWQAVFNATSYHITYTSDNGQNWNLAASNHTGSSINIGGTPNSLTYIVAVRAGNQHGWSGWRNSAPAGPYTPPATPSHPYGLRASGGYQSVTLTWSNPINSTITHYMYQYRAAPPAAGWSAWKAIANSDAGTTYFAKTGLTNGTEYRFKLRAVNAYGASASAPNAAPWYVAATPHGGIGVPPPPKPKPAPGAPASVTVTRSATAVTASWDAVSGATSYQIMYSSDGEATWTYASRNHTSNSISISNISNSATYVVAVSARNNNGSSPYTKSAPIGPPALSVSDIGKTSATLTLNNYTGDWNYKADGGPDNTCKGPMSAASKALTGLTSGTEYTYTAYRTSVASPCSNSRAIDTVTFTTLSTPGARDSGKDFDTLTAAGNTDPTGIWSDGTTMWVQDLIDRKAYAYNLTTKVRDASKDVSFSHVSLNASNAVGMGSDGTTMWTGDSATDDKLFAYTISGNSRDTSKDITLDTDNRDTWALWANSTTIWVGDWRDKHIYAYSISGKSRDASKDIRLHTDNDSIAGLWSDGVTMWVTDNNDNKLYAYKMSDGSRDSAKDYTLDSANNVAYGIWSDGTTMWVADYTDGKLYAYHAFKVQLSVSDTARTSATLTMGNYTSDWYYKADGGPDSTCQGPVSATSKALTGLTAATEYTYTAYSASGCGSATEIAATTFTTLATPGARDSGKDFDTLTAAGNNSPDGIWSNGTTMWVQDFTDKKAYAYTLATKARDSGKDVSFSGDPIALGSDGTTMWTADSQTTDKLFAYSISGKTRDASKDITLHTNNEDVSALWANSTTIWVGDWGDDYIYAYTIATSARDSGKDIDMHADNGNVHGVWSDGVTMWIADDSDQKLYAYKMSDGSRDSGKDYNMDVENDDSLGIWSDGTTMWVADDSDDKLYAYHAFTVQLNAGDIAATTATLTLTNYREDWYYKADGGPDNTCQGPVSGTSEALTGLTAATEYTYTAYSAGGDSPCASANEIAAATFTTLAAGITATGISGTGATLNMTGYTSAWSYKRTAGPADTTCSDISSGTTTATLSSLTADTLYGYTSYSGSGCTTANKLYTVHFSTTDYGVGNLDETVSASCAVGHVTDANQCAVAFTTGARSGGYTLASITAGFNVREGSPGDLPNIASITVAIHAADTTNSSNPASSALVTLSGSDPDTAGLYTYTCSGNGCDLSASTTYFVVMSTTDTSGLRWYVLRTTPSDVETAHPAANGWSIANVGRFKQGSAAWVDYGNSRTPLLHIAADDAP